MPAAWVCAPDSGYTLQIVCARAESPSFRFCFTLNDIRFYLRDFLGQNIDHSEKSDHGEIAPVYNRGNDFYNWFLGASMTFTSGVFEDQEDSLEDAQRRKLELVCQSVQMQPGDRHLDIGCG